MISSELGKLARSLVPKLCRSFLEKKIKWKTCAVVFRVFRFFSCSSSSVRRKQLEADPIVTEADAIRRLHVSIPGRRSADRLDDCTADAILRGL
jgi:hypothetical protein